jgi:hypothetical protein
MPRSAMNSSTSRGFRQKRKDRETARRDPIFQPLEIRLSLDSYHLVM